MCLAIPGRVLQVWEEGDDRVGEVDFDGVRRKAYLLYTPEVEVGDYVVVHAGFATNRVPTEEALEAQRLARGLRLAAEKGGPVA